MTSSPTKQAELRHLGSPRSPGRLRKLQSAHQLSTHFASGTNGPSLITQQRQQQQRNASISQNPPVPAIPPQYSPQKSARTRSNSETDTSGLPKPVAPPKRLGVSHKAPTFKSDKEELEWKIRHGPQGSLSHARKDLGDLILRGALEADRDGMGQTLDTITRIRSPDLPASDLSIDSLSDNNLTVRSLANGSSIPGIYVQGMNVLCAPFLYVARSEAEAFVLFHDFITRECPGYIRGAMDGVHKGLQLVDRCLEIADPVLSAFLLSRGLKAEIYAFASVLTMCASTPPLQQVLRLWDFLFAYGVHLNILCICVQLMRRKHELMNDKSPGSLLRTFPDLDAEDIIGGTVNLIQKIPDDLYQDLVTHMK
ncbi:uncharacterized protein KY384_008402 [Bacidia gigantensis]|uniref:uncharacterized protein n=1 Tax=Bacidia gigantensis TaxID=2732470 RepID=UPI001D05549A|nr:uncharacterized protein KY384_008402 [Bacidia gigantensis]KAG8526973.1 hypothetical protein KY384_008402 [Bacidia gigantensis]